MHVELEAGELIQRGVEPAEAHRRAAVAFGGVQQTKEEVLDAGLPRWVEALRRDSRIAFRSLWRHRTFSVAAILALSLAIAVNTTTFAILDAMINPTIGAEKPDRMYGLKYFGDPRKKVDFSESARATAAAASYYGAFTEYFYGNPRTVEHNVVARDAHILKVRQNFFAVLGVKPVDGVLAPSSTVAGTSHVVVISSSLSRLFFGGSRAVGQSVLLDGTPYTVIGVVNRFNGMEGLDADVWFFARPTEALGWKIVRLKDGATLPQMQEKLDVLAKQLALTVGQDTRDTRFYMYPLQRQFHIAQFHYALIGAGIAILLVACSNLANLQLARGLTRSAELAVRSSLGASRRQIVMQLLWETAAIALAALFVAVIFALIGNALLRAYVPPTIGEYVVQPQTSWRMMAAASSFAAICVVAVGLLPALRVSRVDLNTLLKGRTGTGAHKANRRVYSALVIAQIGLALPLACAAVVMSISAWKTANIDYLVHDEIGYDPRPLVDLTVPLKRDSVIRHIPEGDVIASTLSRAQAVPGVDVAAFIDYGNYLDHGITFDDAGGGMHTIVLPGGSYAKVSREYMRTLGHHMKAGADFENTRGVDNPAIVDEITAERLWPAANALGRTIKFGSEKSNAKSYRVVGVIAEDLSAEAKLRKRMMMMGPIGLVYRLVEPTDSLVIGRYWERMGITVRARGNAADLVEPLRRAFFDNSRGSPRVMTYLDRQGIPRRQAVTRFMAGLFITLGAIGLGLSALGVYAIVSQSVADRKREVAVRIALGASPKNIVYALLREGNVLVLGGVALGLLLTKQTVSWIGMFAGEADMYNAPLFALISIALFAAMVLAALGPAMRATKMDPMEVLRSE